jgi:hypothetical protein
MEPTQEKYVDPKIKVREDVFAWLKANPGPHSIVEIADALCDSGTGMRRGYVYAAVFILKDQGAINYDGNGYSAP